MGKVCQLVMGPAGSGKSTYCETMLTHFVSLKRTAHLVNLDPAAEAFEYEPTVDIRNLITLEEVMKEYKFGPNGGLIYCLEHLVENMDWLEEQLSDFDEDYLLIDCPGQIELYTHFPVMKNIVATLLKLNYKVCGVFLLDSQFVQDTTKFFAGVMTAMSAMIKLEIPHVNVLTKMDLLDDSTSSQEMDRFLDADTSLLLESANSLTSKKYHALNQALIQLIDEYSMVSLIPLNPKEEDTIAYLLSHIDTAVQFGEDAEPVEPKEAVNDD